MGVFVSGYYGNTWEMSRHCYLVIYH